MARDNHVSVMSSALLYLQNATTDSFQKVLQPGSSDIVEGGTEVFNSPANVKTNGVSLHESSNDGIISECV
jgi:hypothetical protein